MNSPQFTSLSKLVSRGLIYQTTSSNIPEGVNERSVYCGFDPTARSLHLGNLQQLLMLIRISEYGYTPIALIGGATGQIGDPSGKLQARVLEDKPTIAKNGSIITNQVGTIMNNCLRMLKLDQKPIVLDNSTFYRDMNVLDFLRDIGKHFRMGAMLSNKHVAQRLENEESLSFTEFSYPLLQAYDYLKLYEMHKCQLQLGGSDQWGNIAAGCDLVRRVTNQTVYGLTTPLLVNKQGQKFGKSEGNAISLDNWDGIQQYLMSQSDDMVEELLQKLTFIETEEISSIVAQHMHDPSQRVGQRALVDSLYQILHGPNSQNPISKFYQINYKELRENPVYAKEMLDDLPKLVVPQQEISIIELILLLQPEKSKSEVRRLIQGKGVILNGETVQNPLDRVVPINTYALFRFGKKEFKLAQFI